MTRTGGASDKPPTPIELLDGRIGRAKQVEKVTLLVAFAAFVLIGIAFVCIKYTNCTALNAYIITGFNVGTIAALVTTLCLTKLLSKQLKEERKNLLMNRA